jgi:hypothetical protein
MFSFLLKGQKPDNNNEDPNEEARQGQQQNDAPSTSGEPILPALTADEVNMKCLMIIFK